MNYLGYLGATLIGLHPFLDFIHQFCRVTVILLMIVN